LSLALLLHGTAAANKLSVDNLALEHLVLGAHHFRHCGIDLAHFTLFINVVEHELKILSLFKPEVGYKRWKVGVAIVLDHLGAGNFPPVVRLLVPLKYSEHNVVSGVVSQIPQRDR